MLSAAFAIARGKHDEAFLAEAVGFSKIWRPLLVQVTALCTSSTTSAHSSARDGCSVMVFP